jgi:hypothetical protein
MRTVHVPPPESNNHNRMQAVPIDELQDTRPVVSQPRPKCCSRTSDIYRLGKIGQLVQVHEVIERAAGVSVQRDPTGAEIVRRREIPTWILDVLVFRARRLCQSRQESAGPQAPHADRLLELLLAVVVYPSERAGPQRG